MDDSNNEPQLHSSDLLAMTNAALHCLFPTYDTLPPYFRQWIKDGLMIEMHKAYQNSVYAREAMKDDT
jgi:hypothetical protein